MRHAKIALLLCAVALGGCSTVASGISDITVAATTASPSQATTVAEAIQATTLTEQALDLYVKTGNPDPAVLKELQVLVPAVHNALVQVETANTNGNSALAAAAMAAFNQALAAVNSYETLQGVSH